MHGSHDDGNEVIRYDLPLLQIQPLPWDNTLLGSVGCDRKMYGHMYAQLRLVALKVAGSHGSANSYQTTSATSQIFVAVRH